MPAKHDKVFERHAFSSEEAAKRYMEEHRLQSCNDITFADAAQSGVRYYCAGCAQAVTFRHGGHVNRGSCPHDRKSHFWHSTGNTDGCRASDAAAREQFGMTVEHLRAQNELVKEGTRGISFGRVPCMARGREDRCVSGGAIVEFKPAKLVKEACVPCDLPSGKNKMFIDVAAYDETGTMILAIEVYKTHKCEDEKREWIKANLPAVFVEVPAEHVLDQISIAYPPGRPIRLNHRRLLHPLPAPERCAECVATIEKEKADAAAREARRNVKEMETEIKAAERKADSKANEVEEAENAIVKARKNEDEARLEVERAKSTVEEMEEKVADAADAQLKAKEQRSEALNEVKVAKSRERAASERATEMENVATAAGERLLEITKARVDAEINEETIARAAAVEAGKKRGRESESGPQVACKQCGGRGCKHCDKRGTVPKQKISGTPPASQFFNKG